MRIVTIRLLLVLGMSLALGPGPVAHAQMGDPLGLISAGALIPYVGTGKTNGAQSLLVVSAPVGAVEDFHMVFFDSTCSRSGATVSLPLTAKDVALLRLDDIDGNPTSGLVAVASTDVTGFSLVPLTGPIHARALWINVKQNFVRVLDPISLRNAEAPDQEWNPLRTAASFYAEQETATVHSTLVLICPTKSVVANVFPPPEFPKLVPKPVASGSTPLHMRVYDTDEVLLRDFRTTCSCLSQIPLLALTPIYSDPASALGTYTEIFAGDSDSKRSFTGYLATSAAGRDRFSRLHNGSAVSLQGTLTPGTR